MSTDILSVLASLGVSGQVIGYGAMVISIATILVRYLPAPGASGAYLRVWRALSWLATLRAASDAAKGGGVGGAPGTHANLAVLLVAAMALSACSTSGSLAVQSAQIASDVNLIASGLQAVLPQVASLPGVSPAQLQNLKVDVSAIQADAAVIAGALAAQATVPASRAQEIARILGDIASGVLPSIPGGGAFVPVVQAAQALLPELLAAAGVTGAPAALVGPAPDVARVVLGAQVAHARAMLAH